MRLKTHTDIETYTYADIPTYKHA